MCDVFHADCSTSGQRTHQSIHNDRALIWLWNVFNTSETLPKGSPRRDEKAMIISQVTMTSNHSLWKFALLEKACIRSLRTSNLEITSLMLTLTATLTRRKNIISCIKCVSSTIQYTPFQKFNVQPKVFNVHIGNVTIFFGILNDVTFSLCRNSRGWNN